MPIVKQPFQKEIFFKFSLATLPGSHVFNKIKFILTIIVYSRDMKFPTMWYVRAAKSEISLRIRAV